MRGFGNFLDKKARESKRQLEVIQKVLEKQGMEVSGFLEDEDPYLFLRSKSNGLSFEGVRIYKIGSNLAYRVQKEEKTHPFGKAYNLDIEGMFEDLISDTENNEEKAGQEVIKAINKEFARFFEKSSEAEKETRAGEFDQRSDPSGRITVNASAGANDYSNTIGGDSRGT